MQNIFAIFSILESAAKRVWGEGGSYWGQSRARRGCSHHTQPSHEVNTAWDFRYYHNL